MFPAVWRAAGARALVGASGAHGWTKAAVVKVWVAPRAASPGDLLTLLVGTRALQSTQQEGGDVPRGGHEAGEELLPALH